MVAQEVKGEEMTSHLETPDIKKTSIFRRYFSPDQTGRLTDSQIPGS